MSFAHTNFCMFFCAYNTINFTKSYTFISSSAVSPSFTTFKINGNRISKQPVTTFGACLHSNMRTYKGFEKIKEKYPQAFVY